MKMLKPLPPPITLRSENGRVVRKIRLGDPILGTTGWTMKDALEALSPRGFDEDDNG